MDENRLFSLLSTIEENPRIKMSDLRAKGFTDDEIDEAIQAGYIRRY